MDHHFVMNWIWLCELNSCLLAPGERHVLVVFCVTKILTSAGTRQLNIVKQFSPPE